MNRQNIYTTDHDGNRKLVGWFDPNAAERFDEATDWDGQTHLSRNTGSPWAHEALWVTSSGRFALSHMAGGATMWRYLDSDEAREWLILNDVGAETVERVTGEALPAESGRPAIGPQVKIRMPQDLIDRVDDLADLAGLTRSAWIRMAVERAAR